MVSGNIRVMKDLSTLHTVRAYQMHTVQLRSTTNSGSLTYIRLDDTEVYSDLTTAMQCTQY